MYKDEISESDVNKISESANELGMKFKFCEKKNIKTTPKAYQVMKTNRVKSMAFMSGAPIDIYND